jgi:hypothetical protein
VKKQVPVLTNIVISTNKDTLISNFHEDDEIDYELLMKKILLPYFKMKSRILKKAKIFKIGEIVFKVIGLSPGNRGVINSKTHIQCNSYYSTSTGIKRCLLLTTQKYDNFNQEVLIKELMAENKPIVINKYGLVQVKHYEFYVRNCEPDTGVINQESVIKIENNEMLNINRMKVAVIKVLIINIE